eukprot:1506785-Pyramimonas_sp.AAC.1
MGVSKSFRSYMHFVIDMRHDKFMTSKHRIALHHTEARRAAQSGVVTRHAASDGTPDSAADALISDIGDKAFRL